MKLFSKNESEIQNKYSWIKHQKSIITVKSYFRCKFVKLKTIQLLGNKNKYF